jgi:hypothetical protein
VKTTWLPLVVGLAALPLAAAPVFAQTHKPAERHESRATEAAERASGAIDPAHKDDVAREADKANCVGEAQLFDDNAKQHRNAKNYEQAMKLRDEGLATCEKGDYSKGMEQLGQAMKLLGMRS